MNLEENEASGESYVELSPVEGECSVDLAENGKIAFLGFNPANAQLGI